MAGNLYSESLADQPLSECASPIQESIVELEGALRGAEVAVKSWNKDWVAAVLALNVDLPTRGTVGGVDIRPIEPVLVLFHRTEYPDTPPLAKSDRKDFPSAHLPHLNPDRKGSPAEFCLHRGSIQDWFAEHSILDYLDRVRGWLRDAASGRLIREEDRFEPTRLPGTSGICIYDDDALVNFVQEQWVPSATAGASVLFSTLLRDFSADPTVKSGFSMRVEIPLGFDEATPFALELSRLYSRLAEQAPKMDRLFYSVLMWPSSAPSSDYLSSLPATYGELREFASSFGMDLHAWISLFRSSGLQIIAGIPVLLTLVRPQPLIGSKHSLELIAFVVLANADHIDADGEILPTAPVFALGHRRPITTSFARSLSSVSDTLADKRLLLIGCGAEGSKIGLHLGRAGVPQIQAVDTDTLSPHNLVRHALLPESLGKNKAVALKEQLERIFSGDENLAYEAAEVRARDAIRETDSVDMVVDATASNAVMEALVQAETTRARIARCEMTDAGRLGFLLLEGPNRLPRLDDLRVQLYDLALQIPAVANWLGRHRQEQMLSRGPVLEDIDIGISCNSDTMRLSDDVVSYHAATFAIAIRSILGTPPAQGRIQLSSVASGERVEGGVLTVEVGPPSVLEAHGDPSWSVRISAAARAELRRHLASHRCFETGGLLVGMIHKKRRTIYVSRVLPPSRDSHGSPYAFRRGVRDYPEILDRIHQSTGNLLGYVGEWHTHPRSKAQMSDTDKEAVRQIRETLAAAQIPAHIIIVAPDEMNSFVFPSG